MDMFGGQGGGPGGLFAQLAQGFGGGFMPHQTAARPESYDEYLKAYSTAMLPGRERENLSYGGKIVMPQSALARLTQLDLPSPWMFKLRNPANAAASTHAGVLEFIANEGCVHLPFWMMKTLRLEEGDPIRITGAQLQKGKFVKLQAQHVHFLEISDPKSVLEVAMRNFSALTQGDIIEISYNSIVFGLLIMETRPGGEGIDVMDTDLEVDFAAPVGYVEPERPKPAPPTTMASKLKIDVNESTPGSSRPGSSLSGAFAGSSTAPGATLVSKGGDEWESFKGKGETLTGRKTKGKGITHRPAEQVSEGSKIIKTDNHRIVNNNTLEVDSRVPAPLILPFGKLFFGFKVVPYDAKQAMKTPGEAPPPAFSGTGNTLLGGQSGEPSSSNKGKAKEAAPETRSWGGGNKLGASSGPTSYGVGGARIPQPPRRNAATARKERSPTPDFGVDDDEIIEIDSD